MVESPLCQEWNSVIERIKRKLETWKRFSIYIQSSLFTLFPLWCFIQICIKPCVKWVVKAHLLTPTQCVAKWIVNEVVVCCSYFYGDIMKMCVHSRVIVYFTHAVAHGFISCLCNFQFASNVGGSLFLFTSKLSNYFKYMHKKLRQAKKSSGKFFLWKLIHFEWHLCRKAFFHFPLAKSRKCQLGKAKRQQTSLDIYYSMCRVTARQTGWKCDYSLEI